MKAVLSILAVASVVGSLHGSEYVTLHNNNPSVILDPGDVVEVLTARYQGGSFSPKLNVSVIDGPGLGFSIPSTTSDVGQRLEGRVFTGLSGMSLTEYSSVKVIVTLRVTGPNEGFTSDPVVVPVAGGTRYSVSLETSTDLQAWAPAAPGDYTSTSEARFFRVRAVVVPDP
ncbi:hypothetical protein [Haloferula sp. A504]|uniref:hypothetical protein n=1 Tax=Haloferula sp. A504 TaxID=3373601 RepID=UPI0031C45B3D|nr:hypothetical protein [Verrucomicrobiaceae bacterium E54]